MEELIAISQLNDFIFCPYSIYLHNIYRGTDEDNYQATPQLKGRFAHATIDNKQYSNRMSELTAMPVCSMELGIIGKIDLYRGTTKELIERKYQLKQIFQGQIYQLWAQYYCMCEAGYRVESLSFYELSTRKSYPIALPSEKDKVELIRLIDRFRNYDPSTKISVNENKCKHCIYASLCDKIIIDNVYN